MATMRKQGDYDYLCNFFYPWSFPAEETGRALEYLKFLCDYHLGNLRLLNQDSSGIENPHSSGRETSEFLYLDLEFVCNLATHSHFTGLLSTLLRMCDPLALFICFQMKIKPSANFEQLTKQIKKYPIPVELKAALQELAAVTKKLNLEAYLNLSHFGSAALVQQSGSTMAAAAMMPFIYFQEKSLSNYNAEDSSSSEKLLEFSEACYQAMINAIRDVLNELEAYVAQDKRAEFGIITDRHFSDIRSCAPLNKQDEDQ